MSTNTTLVDYIAATQKENTILGVPVYIISAIQREICILSLTKQLTFPTSLLEYFSALSAEISGNTALNMLILRDKLFELRELVGESSEASKAAFLSNMVDAGLTYVTLPEGK